MGRSKAALPSRSVAKAAAMMRGKRSGVVVDTRKVAAAKNGAMQDDMDLMFESAKTPPGSGLAGATDERTKPSTSSARQANRSKNPTKPIRLSLTGGRDDTASENGSLRKSSRTQYQARVTSNNRKRTSWSPSELSAVSTAPPTPRDPQEKDEDDDEEELQLESQMDTEEGDGFPAQDESQSPSSDDFERREPKPSLRELEGEQLTEEQENETPDNFSNRDEELKILLESAKAKLGRVGVRKSDSPQSPRRSPRRRIAEGDSESEKLVDEQGNSVPTISAHGSKDLKSSDPFDETDEDDGDLIPPHPPEEDFWETQDEREMKLPARQKDPKTPSHEQQQRDLDDDDDDGAGFAMMDDEEDMGGSSLVHDPETPASVRASRARREHSKLEKVRARSKNKDKKLSKRSHTKQRRQKKEREGESSSEDETPENSRRSKKATAFAPSPKGYPSGPREFETESITNFIEPSPENPGVRRSRRARVRPLEFWKNEKLVLGAHKETGLLGVAMGNMPVVTGVQKALPTPYKKRTIMTRISKEGDDNRQRKRSANEASKNSIVEKAFDYHKLRKKGRLVEGESARVWDDSADDSLDLSKCILACPVW
jgi:hypothetical protein